MEHDRRFKTDWGVHATAEHFELSVLHYREQGLSHRSIGKLLGTSGTTVSRVLNCEISQKNQKEEHRLLLRKLFKCWPAPPHCFEEVMYD